MATEKTVQFREEKKYDERVINIDRVARVVKGGRRFRFRALVVVGDHKGSVGIGVAKGADVTTAITKAADVAKKEMVKVTLYKHTIPHEVEAKVSGANVLIKPASPGTGIIAGGAVRAVLEVVGVSDVLSKSLGSSNKVNIAYAVVAALQQLAPQSEWITAQQQNKKAATAKAVTNSDSTKASKKSAPKTKQTTKKKEVK